MADFFEAGQNYIFYFYYENHMGFQQITGRVVSYEHPIVRVETNGLIRIINCSSNFFIEAIKRNPGEELEALELEKEILPKSRTGKKLP